MSQIERIKQAIMADPQNTAIQNAESNLSLRRQKLPVSILSVRLLGLKRKKLGFIGRIRVAIACVSG